MKKLITSLLTTAVISCGYSATVAAHASLETQSAETGSTYKAVMRIGHGCDGNPTRVVRIQLPLEIRRAKPMPKAGWQLQVVTAKLDQPFDYYGHQITEDVREIIWSGGSLDDSHYDEFVFRAKLAGEAGQTLYLNTIQECDQGQKAWNQIPAEGQDSHDLKSPAPQLKLTASHHKH